MKGELALLAAAVIVASTMGAVGQQVVWATDFQCTGSFEGGLCWLRDVRLRATASWTFVEVPSGGEYLLVLEALATDPCDYCIGRDVLIRLYWREVGATRWQIIDLRLENVTPEAGPIDYTVRAEVHLPWSGAVGQRGLMFRAKRVLLCDPRVGFGPDSLMFRVVPAPAPPSAPPPPAPPPIPPPEEVCGVDPTLGCWPEGQAVDCAVPAGDPWSVPREELADTYSPDSAYLMEAGDYLGHLGGLDPRGVPDHQDWYRIAVPMGEAMVLWIGGEPGLEYSVYIADWCGRSRAEFVGNTGTLYCVAPCEDSMCVWYVRLVRKSGEGDYFMSLIPVGVTR
ncbi:MAG: hypothetical protein ACP5G2_02000 [Candidatus Bipolaricaulaceae bacterium]